jgi:hypothetical protein
MKAQSKSTHKYTLDVKYMLFLRLYYPKNYQSFIHSEQLVNEFLLDLNNVHLSRTMETSIAITEAERHNLRSAFNLLLESRELNKYDLGNVADTLFFTCLHFANIYWPEEEDYRLTDRNNNTNPDVNRYDTTSLNTSIQNVKELSSLFSELQKAKGRNTQTSMLIEIGGIPITISHPQLRNWIFEMVEASVKDGNYPLQTLGEHMYLLSDVLKKQDRSITSGDTPIAQDLKMLTQLSEYSYKGMVHKRIKSFCIDVHKMLTHLMNEDPEFYSAKQLRLYAYILKLFNVFDFTADNPSISTLANRLRTEIKRDN